MKTEKPEMTYILLFSIMASCGSETVLRIGLVTAVERRLLWQYQLCMQCAESFMLTVPEQVL